MRFRPEREKAGYCRIGFRNSDWADVARNEFEPLMEALKRGDQWYEAVDLFGATMMIRLSEVDYVGDLDAAAIAAQDADHADRVAHNKAHGGIE